MILEITSLLYGIVQKMDPLAQNSRWQEQELTYGSMSFSKMLVMYEKYAGSLTRYSVTLPYVSLCRGAALQGLSCRILRYILHTTQRGYI
jgi:hypothetical protein